MISTSNITLRVGKKALFEDVNIKFTEGNCYGLIGANGAENLHFLRSFPGSLSRPAEKSSSHQVSVFLSCSRTTSNTTSIRFLIL